MSESERRRTGLSEEELDTLAGKVADRVKEHNTCKLTAEQQQAVIEFITAKKKAVRATLWLFGALILWALKDAYLYVTEHITLGWGK